MVEITSTKEFVGPDHHMRTGLINSFLTRVKSGKRVDAVLGTSLALQTFSIEPDVPIRELLNELEELWNDTVQVVCLHFVANCSNQRLTVGQDPLILNKG